MSSADTELVYKYLSLNPRATVREVGKHLKLKTPHGAHVYFQALMLMGRLEKTYDDRKVVWKVKQSPPRGPSVEHSLKINGAICGKFTAVHIPAIGVIRYLVPNGILYLKKEKSSTTLNS